ncbi:MAG: protein TolQ [Deltaproteobacteria bacterium]|nr:protein TolQ [Deltaproteobacteria bacterium]
MSGEFHESVLMMIWGSSFVVQSVLLLLFIFSVVSWAVIITKMSVLKGINAENKGFVDIYLNTFSLKEIHQKTKDLRVSGLANIFRAAYEEWEHSLEVTKNNTTGEKRLVDNVERTLTISCNREVRKLEEYLIILASTASAAPFIGLFGTVWGIMDTFRAIGFRGAATLAVVAPGISEALVATAFGLVAAIPASLFYNHFQNRIREMRTELNDFADELLNIVDRNGR